MDFPLLNKELKFNLTGALELKARDFAEKRLLPIASSLDSEQRFPVEELNELARMGFMALCIPKSSGGLECRTVEYANIMREISKACPSTSITLGVTNMVALIVERHAKEPLLSHYRERFKRREPLLLSFAITEPGAGSDARAIETTYEKTSEGFSLRGHKCFISTGAFADAFVTTARSQANPEQISSFLVPRLSKGLRVGTHEKKLGLLASNTVQLFFEDVSVPEHHLLGEEGDGFKIAMTALNGGRIGVGCQALGIAEAAVRVAFDWATSHPLGQGNRWLMADMLTKLEAGMLMIHHAADLADRGKPYQEAASRAKLFCTEEANKIVATAFRIVGKEAYSDALPIERHIRDCRVTTLYEGTSEIQRLVIARGMLKKGIEATL